MMLLWFLYLPYQKFLINIFRQKNFSIRDKLFLDFEQDEITKEFREIINLQVRFLHKLNIWRIVFFYSFSNSKNQNKKLEKFLKKLEEHKNCDELLKLFQEFAINQVLFVIVRSPFVLLFVVPFVLIKWIVSMNVQSNINNFSNKTISTASEPAFYT